MTTSFSQPCNAAYAIGFTLGEGVLGCKCKCNYM